MLIFDRAKLRREILELKDNREAIKQQITELNADYDKIKHLYDVTKESVNRVTDEYNELTNKCAVIEVCDDYGIPYYEESLDELENRLAELQSSIDDILSSTWTEGRNNQWRNGGLWKIDTKYTVNDSIAKGNELQKAIGSGLCYMINSYIANKEKSLTTGNIAKSKDLIAKKFNAAQKKANKVGLSLNSKYINCRLDMMDVRLAIKAKKEEERKRLREEKRRMREQERLLAEIAAEEKRLEDERKAMNLAFAQALTDQERDEIKSQLADIDRRMDDLEYRKEHNKAGWLYVIASESLPGMVKCGVTRRLNPTIRVKELSSSSLPFAYKAYGFVFSDDCFALESAMHHHFGDKRVAPDREFFYITPKEAIDALRNEFHVNVHFVDDENNEEDNDDE